MQYIYIYIYIYNEPSYKLSLYVSISVHVNNIIQYYEMNCMASITSQQNLGNLLKVRDSNKDCFTPEIVVKINLHVILIYFMKEAFVYNKMLDSLNVILLT